MVVVENFPLLPSQYAIMEKSTGHFFPEVKKKSGGYSYTKPEPLGGEYGPRLFVTELAAKKALWAWCKGEWRCIASPKRLATLDAAVDDYFTPLFKPHHVNGRHRGNYEIVRINLTWSVIPYQKELPI